MAFNGTGSNVTSLNASNVASGTLAVARGGTGTASPSLVGGTNITISGTWPNQTVTASGGGVTSLNGQTGAITNTDYGAIGSYVVAFDNTIDAFASTTYADVNSTIAGSNLLKAANNDVATGTTLGSAGLTGATTSAGLSGTWRRMNAYKAGNYENTGYRPPFLLVRIS